MRTRRGLPVFVLLSLVAGAAYETRAAEEIVGLARVVDADTLEVGKFKIRLFGIDAPESRQTCTRGGVVWLCAQEASFFLRTALADDIVKCSKEDIDRYGRIVATCTNAAGEDISSLMVNNGWALAYDRYSSRYKKLEISARDQKAGLWSGEFVPPSDWRRGDRSLEARTPTTANGTCLIKGNINSKGERIYHSPGTAGYKSTRINTAKGERYFCNEQEAEQAGFRRPN